jgi:hypothetical protein
VETGETPVWRRAMRIIGLVMLFAVSAFTQVPPAVTAACGPEKVSFNVKLDEYLRNALALGAAIRFAGNRPIARLSTALV